MTAHFTACSVPSPDNLPSRLGARLEALFHDALQQRFFSGASVLVADPQSVLFEATYGTTAYGPESVPISCHTWFDLASLTKSLVTASLCMLLVAAGEMDLDGTLEAFFPSELLAQDKKPITVRQLLNHCSGLPPYRPYYEKLIHTPQADRPDTLLEWVLAEPLFAPPGEIACYSDLGYVVLQEILRAHYHVPLAEAFSRYFLEPLGIRELGFRRLENVRAAVIRPEFAADRHPLQFAQTEFCPWRKRLLEGEVHDENAYCLEGVAGHAGLFGTARGVYDLLQALWNIHNRGDASVVLAPSVVRAFWMRQNLVSESSWALGFDTPSAAGSSAGTRFSSRSIGHLGFTGTSFWMDLEREILVILLTNRVHPTRTNDRIKLFRPLFHDVVMDCLYARS
jgi:CubicO group peptidase (beta-lactamase class C family)